MDGWRVSVLGWSAALLAGGCTWAGCGRSSAPATAPVDPAGGASTSRPAARAASRPVVDKAPPRGQVVAVVDDGRLQGVHDRRTARRLGGLLCADRRRGVAGRDRQEPRLADRSHVESRSRRVRVRIQRDEPRAPSGGYGRIEHADCRCVSSWIRDYGRSAIPGRVHASVWGPGSGNDGGSGREAVLDGYAYLAAHRRKKARKAGGKAG